MTTALDDFAALGQRITDEIAAAIASPRLEAVRHALNATGIRAARQRLAEAPERIAAAQASLRAAQEAERAARKALDDETLAAEWELEAHFVTEANRTYLTSLPGRDGGEKLLAERRQMTADQRARWVAAEAAKLPGVAEAAAHLRTAEHEVAAVRDGLAVAERAFSAAKADLAGAIAELNALGIGIAAEPVRIITDSMQLPITSDHNGGNHR